MLVMQLLAPVSFALSFLIIKLTISSEIDLTTPYKVCLNSDCATRAADLARVDSYRNLVHEGENRKGYMALKRYWFIYTAV